MIGKSKEFKGFMTRSEATGVISVLDSVGSLMV